MKIRIAWRKNISHSQVQEGKEPLYSRGKYSHLYQSMSDLRQQNPDTTYWIEDEKGNRIKKYDIDCFLSGVTDFSICDR